MESASGGSQSELRQSGDYLHPLRSIDLVERGHEQRNGGPAALGASLPLSQRDPVSGPGFVGGRVPAYLLEAARRRSADYRVAVAQGGGQGVGHLRRSHAGQPPDRDLAHVEIAVSKRRLKRFDRARVAEGVQGLGSGPFDDQARAPGRPQANLLVGQHHDQRQHRRHVADRVEGLDGGRSDALVGVHDGLDQGLDRVRGVDPAQRSRRRPSGVLVGIGHQAPEDGGLRGGPDFRVSIFHRRDQRVDHAEAAPSRQCGDRCQAQARVVVLEQRCQGLDRKRVLERSQGIGRGDANGYVLVSQGLDQALGISLRLHLSDVRGPEERHG